MNISEDINIVILDTEVLRRDPNRIKGEFLALSNLAKNEKIRIHISEVSVKEFLSDQRIKVDAAFSKAIASLKLLQKYPIPMGFEESLTSLIQESDQSKDDTIDNFSKSFYEWCKLNNVKIESVKNEHTNLMFESYFSALPPFKKLKNREDIPDAFIWETISDLCKLYSKVFLISGDNNFREECKRHFTQLTAYEDIKSFLEKEGYISELRLGILEKQLSIVIDHLISFILIGSKLDILIESELIGRSYTVLYPFRGVAQISSIEKPLKVKLEESGRYYGDGLISVPFSARTVSNLKCVVSKNSLDEIKDKNKVVIIPLENDSYELEISRIIVFAGTVLFGINRLILEEETSMEKTNRELENIEMIIESLSIHGESESQVSIDIYNKHAHEEALRQIEEGNLDVELDGEEEKNRVELARWFDVPKELIGKHEKFIIKEGARFKIAPLPRFEEWVKTLKKMILEETKKTKM